MNNHTPADQSDAAAANATESSDQPLIISDKKTTSGDLVIDTTSGDAITVTATGDWQHHGDVNSTGKSNGLYIQNKGVANIKGNATVYGKNSLGIWFSSRGQLTLEGDLVAKGGVNGVLLGYSGPDSQTIIKGRSMISGISEEGLLLKSGCHWSSEGGLTADGGTDAISIKQATFNHYNDLVLQGGNSGLTMQGGTAIIKGNCSSHGGGYGISLIDKAELTLEGDLEVKGNNSGLSLYNASQLSIKSPEKIAIAGKVNGLTMGKLCHFSSEGPMTVRSDEKGSALSISSADTFTHQGTLLAIGAMSGLTITDAVTTITGHTTVQGKEADGLSLSQRSQLTLQGALDTQGGSGGILLSDHSQLSVTEAVTVYASNAAGIKLSEQSKASFKGPITVQAKHAETIELDDAIWNSSRSLLLESLAGSALKMTQARFTHQGSLTAQGKNGVQLTSGSEAIILGNGAEVSEITSEETALQIEASTLRHQGPLQLISQGQGIQLAKSSRAVITGELSIRAKMQPAVSLSEASTLDLQQAPTTIHCQQATLPAVQLASASRWSSADKLAIHSPAEVMLQLDDGHFEHHGPLSLNGESTIAIESEPHTPGQCNVLAITNSSSVTLKVNHPLTVNSILLAAQGNKAGPQVILDSPQLSVNGVIDLSHPQGGSLTLNGAGTLQLDEVKCGPGSRFCIQGNYEITIGTVSFQLDKASSTPPHLSFQLQPHNRLRIGQLKIPAAPIIELSGQQLNVDFDLEQKELTVLPAGKQIHYQAAGQQAPLQLFSDASGVWQMPTTAQLTQALAADCLSEPGSGTRQFYYEAVGQGAPIALSTNATHLLVPTTAKLSSNHPPLI